MQSRRGSNARRSVQLRQVERAGAKEHFAACPRANAIAARPDELDPDGARPLDQHAGHVRAGLDLEVAPSPRRPQIGARRRGAPAIPDRVLAAAKALLLRAVVGRIAGKADRGAGFHPGIEQRIARLGKLRAERASAAAPGVLAGLPRLAAL